MGYSPGNNLKYIKKENKKSKMREEGQSCNNCVHCRKTRSEIALSLRSNCFTHEKKTLDEVEEFRWWTCCCPINLVEQYDLVTGENYYFFHHTTCMENVGTESCAWKSK